MFAEIAILIKEAHPLWVVENQNADNHAVDGGFGEGNERNEDSEFVRVCQEFMVIKNPCLNQTASAYFRLVQSPLNFKRQK